MVFLSCAMFGLLVGVRFGVLEVFNLNNHLHIQGAPIPLVVFRLEDTRWVDFVKPKSITYICALANVLFPVAAFAVPLRILSANKGGHEVPQS